jgi:mannose-6-phosphate isomerase-like protein (cupin superfamily)
MHAGWPSSGHIPDEHRPKANTGRKAMRKVMKRAAFSLSLAIAALGVATAISHAQEKEVHRVVTALDKNNKSVALFDAKVPLKIGAAGEGSATIWATEKGPADFSWTDDRSGARKSFGPPAGGTDLLIVDFPPVGPDVDKLPMDTMMKAVGSDVPKRGVPPTSPLMHRTRTVDYAIVLAGEIDMMLDSGTVHLKAGDVVVQQATNHAWLNHGKEPCRMAFVMMDSQEP